MSATGYIFNGVEKEVELMQSHPQVVMSRMHVELMF
jgi:hypothetical protein